MQLPILHNIPLLPEHGHDAQFEPGLNQHHDIMAQNLDRTWLAWATGVLARTAPPNLALIIEKVASTLDRSW